MRTYRIYLIDDEFASHYFGKERLIIKLFKGYEEASGELKYITKKQIDFITKPINSFKIQLYLQQILQKNKSFYSKNDKYYLEMGKKSKAELVIKAHYITINAKGQYDAETIFFEVLRKAESSFIAIDLHHQRCGWLKPIKERKFV
ncbi:sporulation inhibitor of replication protein SirA [Niallia sp. Krafla_26]|uniref:sporulation inhibitor of replication protein SirA n=1 Tax=Niallia sp. Krafla_26 TaxID=3064703 RepID=UPI003D17D337